MALLLRVLAACFLVLLSVLTGRAQICEGNLGENIFTDGDFGSGVDNILAVNPMIAPGYFYQTTPPPNDGSYTITNNTSQWGSFAASAWANIGDNSGDPEGYMMVVNADYDPGLFYEQEVDGLCEDMLYVFSADIFNLLMPNDNGIKPNVSFLLDGEIVFDTGDVPANLLWNTYGFTFTTAPGQTSVTLALQNNAPGGAGNDLAIDNISFRACGPEALILPTEIANICEDGSPIDLSATINGDQYDTPAVQWQQSFDEGLTWQNIPGATDLIYPFSNLSAGVYYYRYLLANGEEYLSNSFCRVVSNVKIVNVVPKFYTIIDTLCRGLGFELKDSVYTETGVYMDSLLTALGCDSIVTLDLTIVDNISVDASFSLVNPTCSDVADGSILLDTIIGGMEPYRLEVNGQTNATGDILGIGGGDYNYLITDRYGCSLDTLLVVENPPDFFVDIGDDITVDLGESVIVEAVFSEPVAQFDWQTSIDLNCEAECQTLEFMPTSNSSLVITATSAAQSCFAADSLKINVIDVRKVYIPSAFSPNFDGNNDNFNIYGSVPNVQKINRLQVFSRWGELVYEASSFLPGYNTGWDGSINGQAAPDGVYVYVLEVLFADGETVLYKGDVVLLK